MPKIRRALISVSDKTGIVELGESLVAMGVEILSTGGTARSLRDAGIPVTDVSDYTGSPEILDGRLKTLHPKIHGGLLAIRENARHMRELSQNNIDPIDLVVVNLYPFEETIDTSDCTLVDAIEKIDIGGPTMLRAAAKNYQDVAVVVDPQDYRLLVAEMKEYQGNISQETTFQLAQKVFALTARYDGAIATYLSSYEGREKRLGFPKTFCQTFEQVQALRYGENPHQRAAFYRDARPSSEPSLVKSHQLQGKELSYNNIMDTDGALNVVKEFIDTRYAVAIIKHANPCGVAVSDKSLFDAFEKAKRCDSTSAFGGIVALNRPVDVACAEAIASTFFEVIAAPKFDKGARGIFEKKKNLRLIEVDRLGDSFEPSGMHLRKVVGGLLVQDRDVSTESIRGSKVVTNRQPTDAEWKGMEFAWRVAKHVKSNAIVLASHDRTLGIGAGQMSRVDAVEFAITKMKRCKGISLRASEPLVLASDAFFPFRDGIDAAGGAGIGAIIQPGGSLRDEEVIAAANEQNMTMVFTGLRHLSH